MSGAALSAITEEQAWIIYDEKTADAIKMLPASTAIDISVSSTMLNDPATREKIKDAIRAEFEKKGWVKK